MNSVQITITRNDEPINVEVDVLNYYKGSNQTDDPTEVEVDEYGYDEDGEKFELAEEEMEDARSTYLTAIQTKDREPDERE